MQATTDARPHRPLAHLPMEERTPDGKIRISCGGSGCAARNRWPCQSRREAQFWCDPVYRSAVGPATVRQACRRGWPQAGSCSRRAHRWPYGHAGREVWPGPMVASSSTVLPAGRMVTSVHRWRSRCSVSLSPSGKAASKRPPLWSSGRSRTASTRRARLPGARCPAAARSDARAVRTVCCVMLTSADATAP